MMNSVKETYAKEEAKVIEAYINALTPFGKTIVTPGKIWSATQLPMEAIQRFLAKAEASGMCRKKNVFHCPECNSLVYVEDPKTAKVRYISGHFCIHCEATYPHDAVLPDTVYDFSTK